ncbi:hypothetical protein PRIPAC_70446, partial [Pristionchus pacificus]|uniref:G protein-coupled receptor n=1 Tax=Pristionchus pacificus TaxID=54126 RepID=A0A2A6C1G6_PRIPA
MLSIEASLLAAHMGLSCLSIILSILLVYVVFRYTPASFATFAVMLKCHALIDLYVAVGSSSSMQRVIPVNWSIIIISYGPCVYVGSTACYVSCTIFFGGQSFFIHSIVASFVFRLLVIRGQTPTARQALALFCAISLPDPLVYSASRCIYYRRVYLKESHSAGGNILIFGFVDVRSFSACIVLVILLLFGWPLFATIIYLRSKILSKLNQNSSSISEKSKNMQRKFVTMLTFQAAVPLVQLYAAVIFSLEFMDIIRNPALELSEHLVSGTKSFLSPLIVFRSIDQYRRKAYLLI